MCELQSTQYTNLLSVGLVSDLTMSNISQYCEQNLDELKERGHFAHISATTPCNWLSSF